MRRSCCSLGSSIWKRRRTVRLSERRRRGRTTFGSVSRGGFPTEQTPSVQRHFQPGALQRLAACPWFSPLAVPCLRPVETTSPSTFSTKHLHPPYRHCLAFQRTIAHPSMCRGLQSLYLYYWRLSTLKEKNCCYSI